MKNYTRNKEIDVSQSVKKVLEIISTKLSKSSMNITLILLKNRVVKKLLKKTPQNIRFDNDKQAIDIICNSYKNHLSILKIRSTITAKENTTKMTQSFRQGKLSAKMKFLQL